MSDAAPNPSSTPSSTPTQTPSSTPTPTLLDKAHDAVNAAGNWLHDREAAIAHAVASLGLSKPAAELVTTVEDTLSKTLPAVLAAGEKSLADALTPEHIQALATLVGEINAAAVKELLARIPLALATATTTAAATAATV